MKKPTDAHVALKWEVTQTSPKRRLFEAGQMKLLTLHLISVQPKYGYEIIKDIGELVGGGYTPSAGVIYPTLSYLEQQEFVHIEADEVGRKQYRVTPLGLEHLHTEKTALEQLFSRLHVRKQVQNDEQYLDIKRAMENLKTALKLKIQQGDLSPELIRTMAAAIDQAAVNITHL